MSTQTISNDVEDVLSFSQVVDAAKLEHDSLVNIQSQPTSLFAVTETAQIAQRSLRLN